MKAGDLVLRCYAERERDGTWFAICLDLNLYSRSDSFPEAKRKLHTVVRSYIKDALTSDSEYIGDLVPRRAPLYFWLRYAYIWCAVKLHNSADGRKFKDYLPLVPAV